MTSGYGSEPAVRLDRADRRFATVTDWLDSRSSFSYGDHYDPDNVGFGALDVSNHETLVAGGGFDDHPHRDAEVVTWVLRGVLRHEDSTGHRGLTHRGLASRMSAGSGVVHAERNDAYRLDRSRPAVPVEYVQMWVRPDEPGLPPGYAQSRVEAGDLERGWVPVASGRHPDAAVRIASAGSTLWVTTLGPAEVRTLPGGPSAHVYLAAGEVVVETVGTLAAGDALRLHGDATSLRVTGSGPAHAELLVWQLGHRSPTR